MLTYNQIRIMLSEDVISSLEGMDEYDINDNGTWTTDDEDMRDVYVGNASLGTFKEEIAVEVLHWAVDYAFEHMAEKFS